MKTKNLLLFLALILSGSFFSQVIPILNSSPTITNKVVYLDFNGQVVSGTSWNSGNTINAQPSSMSANNITLIWLRVSEDYRPFDVNITTDSMRFNMAPANKRMRVVITPTSAWYTSPAGGVAFLGSFNWGGTPGTPCWIFENQLGYNVKNISEACSHEVGHTLSLRHQSTYDNACTKTAEYYTGQGNGVTGWAPIMGVGYNRNVTTWYNGTSALSCNSYQFDHGSGSPGITGIPYLNFLPDDVGDTYATSKALNLTTVNTQDSGLITTPSDIDTYRFTICNNRYVSVSIKPWALDTANYNGANLDIRFHLYNSANTLLLVDTALTRLHTNKGTVLGPGTYYFTVDGGRSANYSDYGSLGKYYIKIKATNPPVLTNTIVTSPNICLGQSTTFSNTSNGTPTDWQWTVSNTTATATYTTQNPAITFSNAGVYNITLLAINNSSTSCETTQTINVGTAPALALSSNTFICAGTYVPLSASGATSYVWTPGNFAGPSQLVSPAVTTAYTVTASNGMCSNSAVTTVSVSIDFVMNAAVSNTFLCPGQSSTISVTGAPSYTINPGTITAGVAVVSPTTLTYYTITGSNGGCSKTTIKTVSVAPAFNVQVVSSDTTFCAGNSVLLTLSGANNYTTEPGGIVGNTVLVSPTVSTNYTVTAVDIYNCYKNTISNLVVLECTGIEKQADHETLRIYPNPASGNITITSDVGCTKIEVVNALGSLVFENNTPAAATNAVSTDWANGVYFVRAYFKSSEPVVKKIIVKN